MSTLAAQWRQLIKPAPDGQGAFARIEDAIAAIRAGEMVIVADDEDRENEGDLTMAAEKITPEAINFMAKYGRGLICLAMTPQRLDELEIPLMVPNNSSRFETAFCVSIEARERTTTGISAADRAATVLTAIDPAAKPADLVRKIVGIEGYGLSVSEWLPLEIPPSPSSRRYLTAKRNKLGHVLRTL